MWLLLFLKLICASLEMYGGSWHWLSAHYDQMSLHDLSVNLGYGETEKGRTVQFMLKSWSPTGEALLKEMLETLERGCSEVCHCWCPLGAFQS